MVEDEIAEMFRGTWFEERLRNEAGLTPEQIRAVEEIVTTTCRYCWNDTDDCQCWNDE